MIKAVFFDFWGTLVEIGVFPSPVKQVRSILGLHRMPYRKYILTFERHLMLGKSDDLYQAFTKVCEAFRRDARQEILDELVGMWNKNKLLAKPFSDVVETLKTLRKKYKVIMVANSDCFSVPSVIEKYKLEELFDDVLLSFDTGFLKVDHEMFDEACKRAGVKPEEAVMIGDSINSDIRSAQRAGVNAILLDRRGNYRQDYSIESLDELPIAIDELSAELQLPENQPLPDHNAPEDKFEAFAPAPEPERYEGPMMEVDPEEAKEAKPAKKTAAKKTPAKKAPAKKAVAKKVPAKKAPSKKAVAKKVPAKKVAAKKK